MDDKPKPYAGPALPSVAVVHHSSSMHPEFVACGKSVSQSIRRTRWIEDVTCFDCVVINHMARRAASEGGA